MKESLGNSPSLRLVQKYKPEKFTFIATSNCIELAV